VAARCLVRRGWLAPDRAAGPGPAGLASRVASMGPGGDRGDLPAGHAPLIRAVCSPRGAGQLRACSSPVAGVVDGQGGGRGDDGRRRGAGLGGQDAGEAAGNAGRVHDCPRVAGGVPPGACPERFHSWPGWGAGTTHDHPQNGPREQSQKSGPCFPHCWPRRRAYPRGTVHAVSSVAVVRPVSRLAMTK
jgi:hypothetical protein